MTIEQPRAEAIPIACDLTAIPPDEQLRHGVVVASVFHAVTERRELPDGYAFRLPTESRAILLAAEYISRDRLCCPFFTYTLELEPGGGPIWLKLTGPEEAKPLLLVDLDKVLATRI